MFESCTVPGWMLRGMENVGRGKFRNPTVELLFLAVTVLTGTVLTGTVLTGHYSILICVGA